MKHDSDKNYIHTRMKKHILITGSTDGLGKGVALKLAKEGHHLYLHGRNNDKLNMVIEELVDATKNQNIKGFVADFSDLQAVERMAERVRMEVPEIDVLINNAGIYSTKDTFTDRGLDQRFAVNYLAPYILTNRLLSTIKNSSNPRIINLSSAVQSTVEKHVLNDDKSVDASEAYAQSKLAITMWSFKLAKQEPDITVIAVNPGSLLNTKMVKEAFGKHWSSADKGISILFDLVTSEEHQSNSGAYYDNDKGSFARAHSDAYDKEKVDNLIKETDFLIGS